MQFHDLGLAEPIVRAVASEGYDSPTPIQSQAIPVALQGRDVLACAQTGTGKTAAFALPILHRLSQGTSGRGVRALVLSPTRELAGQIADSFRAYGRHLRLRGAVIYGGVSQHGQVRSLRGGVDILVATPGRLLDLMNQGYVNLDSVEVFVLDEADHMLDMGFIHDVRRIAERVPQGGQTMLFSATMPVAIRRLADSILNNPVRIQVAPVSSPVQAIEQAVYHVSKADKPAMLERLLRDEAMVRTLVFTRTKHGADKVARNLCRVGIPAEAIHGNKNQNARNRALAGFRAGSPSVLVATDVAARGIDVDNVTHVINFDVPNVSETYVHRIGRTARAGASGVAISLCDREERPYLKSIEKLMRMEIPVAGRDSNSSAASDRRAPAPQPEVRSTPRPRHQPRNGSHGDNPKASHESTPDQSRGGRGSWKPRRKAGRGRTASRG